MIRFKKEDPKYGCFSNFSNHFVEYNGMRFLNSEAAWQAQKSLDRQVRAPFQVVNPVMAKRMGRTVVLRPDWEEVKYDIMVDVLRAKFRQHPNLKAILLSTGVEEIVEDTTGWHNNIWGDCKCAKCRNVEGHNLLGKALMQVRAELVNEEKERNSAKLNRALEWLERAIPESCKRCPSHYDGTCSNATVHECSDATVNQCFAYRVAMEAIKKELSNNE